MNSRLLALVLLAATLLALRAEPTVPPNAGEDQPLTEEHPGPDTEKLSPEERINRHLERLTKELGLTEDQQAKAKPILEKEAQELADVFENKTLSEQQRRKALHDVVKLYRSRFENILTSDQREKFRAHRLGGLDRFPEGRRPFGPRAGRRP
jgi:Spy/CpxP family protein refolding chaperone